MASGLLECPIPPAPTGGIDGLPIAGLTSLHIVSAVGFTSNRLQFTFFAPPTLLGAIPSFGSTDGGTPVIVAGVGFEDFGGGVACSFGGVETPGKVLSATEVACSSPAAAIAGVGVGGVDDALRFVPLLVTVNGLHYGADAGELSTGSELMFEYTDVPVISFISPITGPPNPDGDGVGMLVDSGKKAQYLRAHGANFRESASLACRFETLLTSAVFLSPSEVDCQIPPLSSATGDAPTVAITVNGVDFSREGPPSTTFTYVARPVLLGILPAMGPSAGGTTVTIVGENFSTRIMESAQKAALICRFELEDDATQGLGDDTSASGVDHAHTVVWDVAAIVESDGMATCVTPAAVPAVTTASGGGYASVHISADGGSSFSTSETRFFFYPEVTVSSVLPATLQASTGGDIVVSGEGFLSGEGLLLCQYEAADNISFPDASQLPAGTSVVQEEETLFVFSTVAVWLSSELLQCELPPLNFEGGTSAMLAVRVTNNGVDLSPSAAQMLVYATPELSILDPATGPRTGGTPIKLTLEGWGMPVTDVSFEVRCQWGTHLSTPGELSSVEAETATEGRVYVTCTSPSAAMVMLASNQEWNTSDDYMVEVGLQIDGRKVSTGGFTFTYYEVPVVLDATPSAGGLLGGTDIVITGSGFHFGTPGKAGFGQTVCMFGEDDVVYAAVVSDSELRCRTPAYGGGTSTETTGASVGVKISMNGGVDSSWQPSIFFQYLPVASTTGEQ